MAFDCYTRPGTPFGAKGPFYDPKIGHRGQDYYVTGAGMPVVAYEDMVIEYVGSTSGLGTVVGARLASDGKHAGWAHLRNVRSFVGGWVSAGTQFAEVAGAGDRPGSLWDGPHIHTTLTPVSSTSYAAANGNTPLEDPASRIAAARMGAASAGRPIIPIPAEQEPDMATGAFPRIGSGEGKDSIFFQDSPGGPLLPLSGAEWEAFAAQGNKSKDFDAQTIQALMRRCGVVVRDKAGRIQRDALGKPLVNYPG
ncbi:peptidoglycan DD-metalloendopeptidase family protein [Plantibacter sp. YIM 135249]|uniref:peptidoglycan DD-metalloendopeptidase family protein n=1 Tax=Plantibacter sp. YIM 135249 TaxID=3423918 RepID=UPI003D3251EA